MRKLTSILFLFALPAFGQDTAAIDKAVNEVLKSTGAPSASIAVVKDGKIVYTHAYGLARIDPPMQATPEMRYSIGSISKQFTASAILMLAEEGKLTLDDKLSRWFPDLTRANDVTIRELLSMTSGYQDYWPQDYVMPRMLEPVTAQEIVSDWAKKPLDFEPGTKWQYSNTNYVIAGMLVEKVAAMPLLDLLQKRVFGPLQMTSVLNTDLAPLAADQPMRYLRYAVGPPRPAPKEGRGWLFAAGELAMTAHDLALWDISVIDQTILKPQSYKSLETEVQLNNGVGTQYGLGIGVRESDGRRILSHGGEVSGFTAANRIYPDDRAATVVLVNLDASGAAGQITSRLADVLFASTDPAIEKTTAQMRAIFEGLQRGKIDRSQFTSNANAYFTDQALKDFAASLGPLGKPDDFSQTSQFLRGGMTGRSYRIKFAKKTLALTAFVMPDGKIEQYQIAAE